eukprot:TRINITY_DN5266_c0_g1_i1.p2 TRINITY_DN5266_c0_g1~~TRINITY_DN5266_c0_g1_i1.p2  ORF type:complete len:227 (-),score=74.59 TRINITY_DN5266_c0_g1_i1:126-806(-)
MFALVGFAVDAAMIVTPVIGYVFQFLEVRRRKSSEGFSLFIPFILIVANLLRVWFFIGKPFAVALLLQSPVMIVAQLVLLHECVRHKVPTVVTGFWNWNDYANYIACLVGIAFASAVIFLPFLSVPWIVEGIGFLSVAVESTLGMPQLYRNYQAHSTTGFSLLLALAWLLGDGVKAVYFVARGAPVQFTVCASILFFVDILLLIQYLIYGNKEQPKKTINRESIVP